MPPFCIVCGADTAGKSACPKCGSPIATLRIVQDCKHCNGTGKVKVVYNCSNCEGKGAHICTQCANNSYYDKNTYGRCCESKCEITGRGRKSEKNKRRGAIMGENCARGVAKWGNRCADQPYKSLKGQKFGYEAGD